MSITFGCQHPAICYNTNNPFPGLLLIYMPQIKELDFLRRRPVQAMLNVGSMPGEQRISGLLPRNWYLENGFLRFPAGYEESYFVNGVEYNVDGSRNTDEQRESIRETLIREGFEPEEADDFIAKIPERESPKKILSLDESYRWLEQHPECEQSAREAVSRTRAELERLESELLKTKRNRR